MTDSNVVPISDAPSVRSRSDRDALVAECGAARGNRYTAMHRLTDGVNDPTLSDRELSDLAVTAHRAALRYATAINALRAHDHDNLRP